MVISKIQRFIKDSKIYEFFNKRQINAKEKNIYTKHIINALVFTNFTIT